MLQEKWPVCLVCGADSNIAVGTPLVPVGRSGEAEVFACAGTCADLIPCPVCGVRAGRRDDSGQGVVSDSSLTTPFERLRAVAAVAGVDVFEIAAECGLEFAGAVAIGYDDHGAEHRLIGLANELTDDLRTDVLAFGLAVFAGATDRIVNSPTGSLGIGRTRLPAAPKGPGHLAWHMVRTCQGYTSSATFDLVELGVDVDEAA